jgi:hypothetical protein
MAKINPTELPLRSLIDELGRENVDVEEGACPAEAYASAFMENLSEAGYTEARPHGRRSIKALANVIRVSKEDLRAVKRLIDFERNDYHEVALAEITLEALRKWAPAALAMSLLEPPKSVKPRGPYYPKCREMNLKTDSNWSFHCLIIPGRSPEMLASMKALAGVFRVNKRDLNKIARRLLSEGCSEADLESKLCEVIIESVRTCHRFAPALG